MILASLNPNLTVADLERLGEIQRETVQDMADAYLRGIEACPPEYRAQIVCETLGMTVSLMLQIGLM